MGARAASRRDDRGFLRGAGGKTLAAAMLMRGSGRIYAMDVSPKRLAALAPRAARAGVTSVHSLVLGQDGARAKRLAGKIDRVLVDAPCSGFGTLRRNPDLKWRHTARAIGELAEKQARILTAAASLCKPGGRVVYATCSVLPAENEAIVDGFLASHPEFALGDAGAELARAGISLEGPLLRLYPHKHGCDGFFAAVMEHRKG